MAKVEDNQGHGTAAQMNNIAQHMQQIGATLGDVVPYLGVLAADMDSGMATVTEDISQRAGRHAVSKHQPPVAGADQHRVGQLVGPLLTDLCAD